MGLSLNIRLTGKLQEYKARTGNSDEGVSVGLDPLETVPQSFIMKIFWINHLMTLWVEHRSLSQLN